MASVKFEVYFDEKFIDTIENEIDNQDDNFKDFLVFCKKFQGGEVDIYTDMSVEKIGIKMAKSIFFRSFNVSGGPIRISFPDLNIKISSKQFYTGSGFKIFFVERDDVEELQAHFGFLYFNFNSLLKNWKNFSRERVQEFGTVPITNNPDCEPRFDSWSYLEKFPHPINSIIICDRYILKDRISFRSNLYEIFSQLKCKNLLGGIQFEILIISELIGKSKLIGKVEHNDIESYGNTIRDGLKRELKFENIQLRLIKMVVDDPKQRSFYREHGRSFITNYWYINPGQSFNFFKRDDLTIKDNMDIRFVFHKEVRNLLKDRLMIFRDIVATIEDTDTQKRVFAYPEDNKDSRLLPSDRMHLSYQ